METRGERIQRAREAQGWTQQELAERLGYKGANAHAKVSLWESNKGPSVGKLEALVLALGINGHWLLTGAGDMHPPTTDKARDSLVIAEWLENAAQALRDATKAGGALGVLDETGRVIPPTHGKGEEREM